MYHSCAFALCSVSFFECVVLLTFVSSCYVVTEFKLESIGFEWEAPKEEHYVHQQFPKPPQQQQQQQQGPVTTV